MQTQGLRYSWPEPEPLPSWMNDQTNLAKPLVQVGAALRAVVVAVGTEGDRRTVPEELPMLRRSAFVVVQSHREGGAVRA